MLEYANQYFILETIYTSTRSKKFFFDDIHISGNQYVDSLKPEVVVLKFLNQSEIYLEFSESVNVDNISIYLNNGLVTQGIEKQTPLVYHVILSMPLAEEDTFLLEIAGVVDLNNNVMDRYAEKLIYRPFCVKQSFVTSEKSIVIDMSLSPFSYSGEAYVEDKLQQIKFDIEDSLLTVIFDKLPTDSIFEVHFINLVSDRGDTIPEYVGRYFYHQPQPFDLVVSEIMFDPVPALDLPEAEYVEIYNRSSFPLFMDDITLQIGNKNYNLSQCMLPAQEFLLLYSGDLYNTFLAGKEAIYLSSMSLPNSGGTLRFLHNDVVLCQATYNTNWHNGSFKMDGGWSLERLDLDNPEDELNWQSSKNSSGGTPGEPNSLNTRVGNIDVPYINNVYVTDSCQAEILFSETVQLSGDEMVFVDSKSIGYKTLSNWTNSIILEKLTIDTFKFVVLEIDGFSDLYGDIMVPFIDTILQPIPPRKGVLVINEVMFNPQEDCPEFIELYNPTEYTVDLSDICISKPTLNDSPGKAYAISDYRAMLGPKSYVVITKDADLLNAYHYNTKEAFVLTPSDMPVLPNESSSLMLLTKEGVVIDSIYYSEKYHYELLSDVKGVSLERIVSLQSGSYRSNWHSASSLAGFATPGECNSQTSNTLTSQACNVKLSKQVISPNNDGTDDFTTLYLDKSFAGVFMTAKILDSNGNMVATLFENALVGKDDEVVWNGTDKTNRILTTGLYLIMVEYWQPGVSSKIERLPVIISP